MFGTSRTVLCFLFPVNIFYMNTCFPFYRSHSLFQSMTCRSLSCTTSLVVFHIAPFFALSYQSFTKICTFLYHINVFFFAIAPSSIGNRQVHCSFWDCQLFCCPQYINSTFPSFKYIIHFFIRHNNLYLFLFCDKVHPLQYKACCNALSSMFTQ